MDVITGIALAAPAGLNAYIPLLAVAVGERLGWITLRAPFDVLGEWWMIALIAVLLVVEIVADKVPAVDSVNDTVQSIVRPAVGGLLAVATTGAGEIAPVVLVVAGVLLAGGVHAAKASARPALNVASAGTAAPVASTAEDIASAGLTVLAFVVPVLVVLAALALIGVVTWFVLGRRGRLRRQG
jgi:uncharacterized membrane protein